MRRHWDRAVSTVVVIGAVLLAAAIASTHWTTAKALDVSAQVAHTHEVLGTLQQILEGLSSARFNTMLFTMSSQDQFLEHSRRGVTKAQTAVARASEMTNNNPAQQQRLEKVRADVEVIVKWLGLVSEARRTEGVEAATKRIFGGQGLHRFTEMRDLLVEAMGEEERLLADREAELAAHLRSVEYARLVVVAAAVILLIGAFAMQRRQNRLLNEARQALQASNAVLELRVEERTRELSATASRLAAELVEGERQKRVIQENEELLGTIIENSADPIFVKDRQGRYRMLNGATASAIGRPREEIVGADDRALFPGDLAEALTAEDGEVMETRKTVTREKTLQMATGRRTYLMTKVPLCGPDGQSRGLFGVGRDITAFRQNEVRLRETAARLEALSAALIDIQEKERRALSRELHDEVGQQLAALKINLARVAEQTSDPGTLDRLGDSRQIVEQIIGRIRETALDLRPQMLDDLGLAPALHWYAQQQQERSGCSIAVRADPVTLPGDAATACYRIVQEAVNNALRHGAATRIDIRLEIRDAEIDLLVADDGCGFDREAQRDKPAPGMGLHGMRERAALLGGTLVIESAPGCGTTLRARIPVGQGKA